MLPSIFNFTLNEYINLSTNCTSQININIHTTIYITQHNINLLFILAYKVHCFFLTLFFSIPFSKVFSQTTFTYTLYSWYCKKVDVYRRKNKQYYFYSFQYQECEMKNITNNIEKKILAKYVVMFEFNKWQ